MAAVRMVGGGYGTAFAIHIGSQPGIFFTYPRCYVSSAVGLAFGGGKLAGHQLVRFVFLDEAGISKHEPYAVVAGVMVHGDTQVIPLEEHLNALIQKHIPEENRDGFVFQRSGQDDD